LAVSVKVPTKSPTTLPTVSTTKLPTVKPAKGSGYIGSNTGSGGLNPTTLIPTLTPVAFSFGGSVPGPPKPGYALKPTPTATPTKAPK